jgi:hypothetical protein
MLYAHVRPKMVDKVSNCIEFLEVIFQNL